MSQERELEVNAAAPSARSAVRGLLTHRFFTAAKT